MNTPAYQTAPITCPKCGNRFVSPVLTIIDVGQHPDLKSLFLSGQVNIAVCPQCGNAGMLSAPIVYHDPGKELLFTFMPTGVGVPETGQERLIGDLTNQVISSLPAEMRKGYLLRPRSFLRLEGMVEAILEADGITPEMLQAQRQKAELLDRLVRTTSKEARRTIAEENDEQIDYEFLQLLTLHIELAQADGQSIEAEQLLALRQQLLDWTTEGREIAERQEAIESLGEEVSREELLDKVVEAALAGKQNKVEVMVAVGRPVIDYLFYQQLTERIEAAQQAGDTGRAETLKALRETILDVAAQIDAEMQEATAQAAEYLQQLLESDDPAATIRANPSRIDEIFFSVLLSNLAAAEDSGQAERAKRLQLISDTIIKIIQESQPPEVQLVNRLLSADYPEGTRAMLEEHRDEVGARLVEMMGLMSQDLATKGRDGLSRRLDEIQQQALALINGDPARAD